MGRVCRTNLEAGVEGPQHTQDLKEKKEKTGFGVNIHMDGLSEVTGTREEGVRGLWRFPIY